MNNFARRVGLGVLGGAAGLLAMDLIRAATRPLLKTRPLKAASLTERPTPTGAPDGPLHDLDESATTSLGRIAYEKLVGRRPAGNTARALSWTVHIGYGMLLAAGYSLIRGGHSRSPVLDGAVFGTGLWLIGDEIAVPLLGLADKRSRSMPSLHVQALAQHLGFGIGTTTAIRILGGVLAGV